MHQVLVGLGDVTGWSCWDLGAHFGIYGVGLANLFFYPVANKLKAIVTQAVHQQEIAAAVFYDIATGDHSRVIDERIATLLREH
jgi:chemotaxis protein MotA